MPGNSFGQIFKFSTWGESHGPAIGCTIDGVPSKIKIQEKDIQFFLDKRSPGSSKFVSQRKEKDKIKILSGIFENQTTGAPISFIIQNKDQRSKDYNKLKNIFRPGHADFTYEKKYGIHDHRGGGRSSARETAMRVVAGAIARKILAANLGKKFYIKGALIQLGSLHINRQNWNWSNVEKNPFWCPDKQMVKIWENYLTQIRKNGSSVGAIIELEASGIPVGLGEPVYDKLDADIAKALMSINAVKGVEIGSGFASAFIPGEESSDEMTLKKGKVQFQSNHAGGILGGISSGQNIIARFVVKPTSSILKLKKTLNNKLKKTSVSVSGRHDPCVGIRAVPIGEAMLACVLADHFLRNKVFQS